MAKITLDAKTFQALASHTRLGVLRALDERRKTLTELARDMDLNKATVHEHLQLLAAAGLVKKRNDEGRKWIYYELTWTGEKLLHPQETTTFNVLLGLSVAAAGGGVLMLGRALGLWLASRPIAQDLSGTSYDAPKTTVFADSSGTTSNGAASQAAPAPATASGTQSATSAPPQTGAGMAAQDSVQHTSEGDTAAALRQSPTDHVGNFWDDGGWLSLALLLAAIAFTVLALVLRNHLRPGRFVAPEKPEDEAVPDGHEAAPREGSPPT